MQSKKDYAIVWAPMLQFAISAFGGLEEFCEALSLDRFRIKAAAYDGKPLSTNELSKIQKAIETRTQ